jgi:hypothetical protein
MGKVWVLDTDTKGTGAEMVPLDKVLAPGAPPTRRRRPAPKPQPRRRSERPRAPHRFRVVDVMTRRTLADDADARAAVAALAGVRSVVDVAVYVAEGDRWRPLTLAERKALWALR